MFNFIKRYIYKKKYNNNINSNKILKNENIKKILPIVNIN